MSYSIADAIRAYRACQAQYKVLDNQAMAAVKATKLDLKDPLAVAIIAARQPILDREPEFNGLVKSTAFGSWSSAAKAICEWADGHLDHMHQLGANLAAKTGQPNLVKPRALAKLATGWSWSQLAIAGGLVVVGVLLWRRYR